MTSVTLSSELVQKISVALLDEIKAAGLYAEIAKEITEPNLRMLISSIVGDEYGHARMLSTLLIAAGYSEFSDPAQLQRAMSLYQNVGYIPISPIRHYRTRK